MSYKDLAMYAIAVIFAIFLIFYVYKEIKNYMGEGEQEIEQVPEAGGKVDYSQDQKRFLCIMRFTNPEVIKRCEAYFPGR